MSATLASAPGRGGAALPDAGLYRIRLLGQEVMPALRETGDQLGRADPFEWNAPMHLGYSTDPQPVPEAAE